MKTNLGQYQIPLFWIMVSGYLVLIILLLPNIYQLNFIKFHKFMIKWQNIIVEFPKLK